MVSFLKIYKSRSFFHLLLQLVSVSVYIYIRCKLVRKHLNNFWTDKTRLVEQVSTYSKKIMRYHMGVPAPVVESRWECCRIGKISCRKKFSFWGKCIFWRERETEREDHCNSKRIFCMFQFYRMIIGTPPPLPPSSLSSINLNFYDKGCFIEILWVVFETASSKDAWKAWLTNRTLFLY